MRTKFKAWAEPFINEHPEVMCDFDAVNDYQDFFLEIGAGKGQFLLNMALNHPNCFFIGMERNVTCAGFTARKLVENNITNAKLVFANAEQTLPLINDDSVNGIFLNFSDPWPKKRHAKRRLTSESFITQYYRILKKGGQLIFKTDNYDLFSYSLELVQTSDFKLIGADYSYNGRDDFDAITEYEEDFREQNLPIYRLILEKA